MYHIRLQALAKILSKWEEFRTYTVDDIITKISMKDPEIVPQLKRDHQKIYSTQFQTDHQDFISTMFTLKKTNIVPHHFAQLKRNSIIFCSSTNTVESFALPERYYPLPDSEKICSFGSYFSSIILSFFLNPCQILNGNQNDLSADQLLTFIDGKFKLFLSNYSKLTKFTENQFPVETHISHFNSFLSNDYHSKEVFSICPEPYDSSLPSFLKCKNDSSLPLSFFSEDINYEYYPDFYLELEYNNKQIQNFLSNLFKYHSEEQIHKSNSNLSISNSQKSSCDNFKPIFSNLQGFLQLIENKANKTLSKNKLISIDLSSALPDEFDLNKLIWYSISKSLNFYRLYCSFQDQIHSFMGYELIVFFHDSRPYFLKMFQDLETKVNNPLQSNNHKNLNSFEIISKEYLPKIVEAMRKVVKLYYKHRRFGSLKGKL